MGMTHDPGLPSLLDLRAQLCDLVGPANVLDRDADTLPYLGEPRGLYRGRTLAVVRPKTPDEVAGVMRLCHAARLSVVPQGGNTGLVGGQTPDGEGRSIVLSLRRLDALREIDPINDTMTAEAGMTLQAARAAAERTDREFPLWLASGGSCTIGGNLATNAGGVNVIAHGNARELVSGIEVVLADGRVLSNLSKLRKDNTGYDLKHLFIGSEGTLGIITAAVLRLVPRPRSIATAFVGVPDPAAALALLGRARDACGARIRAFELMPRLALDFVLGAVPQARDPLSAPYPWYVLVELASAGNEPLADALAALLERAVEDGLASDAAIAASLAQAEALWLLRESVSDAQKRYGGSIKHDISVPVAAVPAFLAAVEPAVRRLVPGARLCAFGHLGDGNIHCNVQQPEGVGTADFLARWDEVNRIVHDLALSYAGSISAEHGIGQLKRDLLSGVKDPVMLSTMRLIKQALDPSGILNPGKVL